MPEGSALRQAIKQLVQTTISELQQQTQNPQPEQGTVANVNDDGTVDVQGSTSFYASIGAAVVLTQGAQVLILTADGRRVAIPR